MKRSYFVMAAAAVGAVLVLANSQPTWSQENIDVQRCNGELSASVEAQMASCSALISSGLFSGPTLAVIYSNRGLLWADQAEYYKAVADFETAINLDPGDAQNFYNRGLAKWHIGDAVGASTDLAMAAKMNPQLPIPKIEPAPANEGPGRAGVPSPAAGTSAEPLRDSLPRQEQDTDKAHQRDHGTSTSRSSASEGRSQSSGGPAGRSGAGNRGGGGGSGPATAGAPSTGGDPGAAGGSGVSGSGGGSGKDADPSQSAIQELANSVKALVEAIGTKGKDDQKSGDNNSAATPGQVGGQGPQPNPNPVSQPKYRGSQGALQRTNSQGQPGTSYIKRRDRTNVGQQTGPARTQQTTTPPGTANQRTGIAPRRTDLSTPPRSSSANTSKPGDTSREHVHSSGRDSNQTSSHAHSSKWGGIHRGDNESVSRSSRHREFSSGARQYNSRKPSTLHAMSNHPTDSAPHTVSRGGYQRSGAYGSHASSSLPNYVRPASVYRTNRSAPGFAQHGTMQNRVRRPPY